MGGINANKILRAGLQSGTIMATADVATQFIIEDKSRRSYDPARTVRGALAGLTCHGPYCGNFEGDCEWLMEMYARHLSLCIDVPHGEERQPPNVAMRFHFREFHAIFCFYLRIPKERWSALLPRWAKHN